MAGIELEASRTTLNPGESLTLSITGIDQNGYRAAISPDAVQFSDDNGMGFVKNGIYTAGPKEGVTVIRASFGGYKAAAAVASGTQPVPLGNLDQYSPSFIGYPASVAGDVSMVSGGQVNASAMKLSYDFTGSAESTAAYAVFGNGGIPLAERPQKIGVWVYADQTMPHWIRGQIKDKNGNVQTIEFTQGVDWTGWKRLEAAVPQTLAMPASLERLYVVE
ncbi:phosphodiester glycosidase family protein, partial [bacterium]